MKKKRRNRIKSLALVVAAIAVVAVVGLQPGGRTEAAGDTGPETAGGASSAGSGPAVIAAPTTAVEDPETVEKEPENRYIFIGDSRTCCIANAVYGTDAWTLGSTVIGWFGEDFFACQFGAHLWDNDYELVNYGINMIDDNTTVFLLMGRNDVMYPDYFSEQYNGKLEEIVQVAQTKQNTQVFFVCVGPDQGYDTTQFALCNDTIQCDGVEKLDPWNSLDSITYQTDIMGDLHYSNETSQDLYRWLKNAAKKDAAEAAALSAVHNVQERIQRI